MTLARTKSGINMVHTMDVLAIPLQLISIKIGADDRNNECKRYSAG